MRDLKPEPRTVLFILCLSFFLFCSSGIAAGQKTCTVAANEDGSGDPCRLWRGGNGEFELTDIGDASAVKLQYRLKKGSTLRDVVTRTDRGGQADCSHTADDQYCSFWAPADSLLFVIATGGSAGDTVTVIVSGNDQASNLTGLTVAGSIGDHQMNDDASGLTASTFNTDGNDQTTITTTLDQATGDEESMAVALTCNKATSGDCTVLEATVTDTASPEQLNYFRFLTGVTEYARLDSAGKLWLGSTTGEGGVLFGGNETGIVAHTTVSQIGFRINGATRWHVTDSGSIGIAAIGKTRGAAVLFSSSTDQFPVYSHQGETTDGRGHDGAALVDIIGNAGIFYISASGVRVAEGLGLELGEVASSPNSEQSECWWNPNTDQLCCYDGSNDQCYSQVIGSLEMDTQDPGGGTVDITVTTGGTYYAWHDAQEGKVLGSMVTDVTGVDESDPDFIQTPGVALSYDVCVGGSYTATANGEIKCWVYIDNVQTTIGFERTMGNPAQAGATWNCGFVDIAASKEIDVRCTSDGNGDEIDFHDFDLVVKSL